MKTAQDNDPLATLIGIVDSCVWVSLQKACNVAMRKDPYAIRAGWLSELNRQLQRELKEVIEPLLNT